MFFYDHAMARDDIVEAAPSNKLDLLDGIRSMTMFKRDPGPIGPLDINQDVKRALASHPSCIMELATEGFLSEQLVRELEQMVKDNVPDKEKYGNMLPSGMMTTVSGPFPSEDYSVTVKAKNSKGPPITIGEPLGAKGPRWLL